MKWMLMFMLVAGTGVMMTSCSSDDDGTTITNSGDEKDNDKSGAGNLEPNALAAQNIVGKWAMQKHGAIDTSKEGTTLEFLSDGKMVMVRPDGNGNTLNEEYTYQLADDWKTVTIDGVELLNGRIVSGSIYGYGEGTYIVWLDDDKISIKPDGEAMQTTFLTDPTMEFVRVK